MWRAINTSAIINNRFVKAGYNFEMVQPPHNDKLLKQLARISNDWLTTPGRVERGLVQGYYTREYIQQCSIALLRDSQGRAQAFLNQVPTVVSGEANYDFLRSSTGSPGNINDFLMLNFINYLNDQGYVRLNMGLCPLSGLGESGETDKSLVNSVLRFGYANGGRFYSFEGLKKFKAKYEPNWESRYVIYIGGLAGFGRTLSALLKAMASTR